MAHFAQIDENNIVVKVLVVPNDLEHRGEDYLANDLGLGGTWIKTSYNTLANEHRTGGTPLRKNFAGIGFIYDEYFDAFIPPKIRPTWKLNYETFQWVPPIPQPEPVDGFVWKWSESNQEWIQYPIA